MGKPAKDITGVTVGYVTAIKKLPSVPTPTGLKPKWLCRCVCGNELELFTSPFLRGNYQSCGCKRKELISVKNTKHGMSRHPLYAIWDGMIARCHRPSHKSYPYYHGQGITVCEKWRTSFQAFAEDMLPLYREGLTLDRIDPTGGYNPENCRWATTTQQANNKKNNRRIITPDGEMSVAEAARVYGIKYSTLLNRVKCGWPQEALFIKTDYRNRIK